MKFSSRLSIGIRDSIRAMRYSPRAGWHSEPPPFALSVLRSKTYRRATFHQSGYTYFGVLFLIMLIGLAMAGAALLYDVQQQREKERELLFVGQQYIDAISSYYHAAPGGAKKYPRNIEELLRDPRYPNRKRHLRKPWRDPLNPKGEWDWVLTEQGGIAGVRSRSVQAPIKQANFGTLDSLLAGKSSYHEWRFIYIAAADDNPKQNAPQSEDSDSENADQQEIPDSADASQDEESGDETGEELLPPSEAP